MQADRGVRRLTALEASASTARVLNLLSTHRKNPDCPDLEAAPFFKNRLLDHSLILKHRLRPNEYLDFESPRPSVTKVLIPIDREDLRSGAQSFFVGQRDFDDMAQEVFGTDLKPGSRDREILELLDALPSLDPFLLREQLRSAGYEPARQYFAISDADIRKMFDFVREEITALVSMSSDGAHNVSAHTAKLVDKLLSCAPDSGFEPLKATLQLSDQEYKDGVFSWRGFLYYKWLLDNLTGPLGQVMVEVANTMPRGPRDDTAASYLPGAKGRIEAGIGRTLASVEKMLTVYNSAYGELTRDSKPAAFRDFLLTAPEMFNQLGEQLGAIQHVVSFWRYRFPPGKPKPIGWEELMDLFLDFEDAMVSSSDGGRENFRAA